MSEIFLSVILLFPHTISSDNELFHGVTIYGKGMELAAESFTLYNQNYEIVYTRENPDANTFFISNTGVVFALNEKRLYRYNQNGEELLLKNLNYPNGFGFSTDNFLFFASDKDGIFAYSNEGDLIYKLNPGRLFASTAKGRLVAIISTDTLFIYEDGIHKFMKRLSTPYARNVSFSNDEKSIIVKEPTKIEMFDSQTDQELQ